MKNKPTFFQRLARDFKRNKALYFIILPVVVYYIIFAYMPMYGVQLAFKDYTAKSGIWGNTWVGMENFRRFFSAYNFSGLLWNTLTISLYSLLVGFPIPIIFALFLNYIRSNKYRKTIQMVSYAPYFISTVVLCGMLSIFMKSDTGIFNVVRGAMGMESVAFLSKPDWFKSIYVWSGVWQGMGFSSIIYISALSAIDPQLHEAALIDGATKIQRILHIDLPGIKPTIVMLLILNLGSLMNVGYEKIYLLQNDLNLRTSDVISTFVYRMGLINNDYGYSTAVGLFNSLINIVLLVFANFLSRKISHTSLW